MQNKKILFICSFIMIFLLSGKDIQASENNNHGISYCLIDTNNTVLCNESNDIIYSVETYGHNDGKL